MKFFRTAKKLKMKKGDLQSRGGISSDELKKGNSFALAISANAMAALGLGRGFAAGIEADLNGIARKLCKDPLSVLQHPRQLLEDIEPTTSAGLVQGAGINLGVGLEICWTWGEP